MTIATALELLPATDQATDVELLLEAAVASDLVRLSGPVATAHSIALTAAGLEACHAVQPRTPRRR